MSLHYNNTHKCHHTVRVTAVEVLQLDSSLSGSFRTAFHGSWTYTKLSGYWSLLVSSFLYFLFLAACARSHSAFESTLINSFISYSYRIVLITDECDSKNWRRRLRFSSSRCRQGRSCHRRFQSLQCVPWTHQSDPSTHHNSHITDTC